MLGRSQRTLGLLPGAMGMMQPVPLSSAPLNLCLQQHGSEREGVQLA
jgi:hypothetical protein